MIVKHNSFIKNNYVNDKYCTSAFALCCILNHLLSEIYLYCTVLYCIVLYYVVFN